MERRKGQGERCYGQWAMRNAQGGNENGARALDEEHGTMRKRARQRHEKDERGNEPSATSNEQVAMSTKQEATGKDPGQTGNERSATSNEQVAMSTEQEATGKDPGQTARSMEQASSGTVLGQAAMGNVTSGKRHGTGGKGHCFGTRDKEKRQKRH